MKTELFDYELPGELIAFHPTPQRDGSRLLIIDPSSDELIHSKVSDLVDHLPPGALLICNDTRVIPARLRGRRPTGGAVEVLLVRMVESDDEGCEWTALCRSNRPLRPGDEIDLGGSLAATIMGKGESGEVRLRVDAPERTLRGFMESDGEVPLPPYIDRAPVPEDKERYQTVFARRDGSVAAPTAGLHFTPALIEELEGRGVEVKFVTLHVGPGTFRPIKAEAIQDHVMDEEHYSLGEETVEAIVAAREQGRPVIAVGTTVVRALEGCVRKNGRLVPDSGFTRIFISPPYEFAVVDGLMTNFHLPRSTLLCLVSALAGRERVLDAYREAVEQRYRFYSYGDAMLVLPRNR